MYLYLGQNTVINAADIIGIFDLDLTSTSALTRAYLNRAQRTGQIIAVSAELPKSFVVCADKQGTRVYLSHISPLTLKKRAAAMDHMEGVRSS